MRNKVILLLAIIVISTGLSTYAEEPIRIATGPSADIAIKKEASSLQVPFIKNEGQITADDVRFYTKLFNGTVFITDKGDLVYSILYPKDYIGADAPGGDILLPGGPLGHPAGGMPPQYISEIIREKLIINQNESGINVRGLTRDQSCVNYIIIDSPENSRDNISTYNLISLGQAWTGITVNLKANSRNIEKLFMVSPEGNPESIKISLDGIEQLSLNESGELEVKTLKGGMSFTRPVAYQEINGERKSVEVAYRIINEKTYGFTVGDYDRKLPLVIDPLLASTYIGGATVDVSNGIARDAAGNVFIVGYTSGIYPTTAGAYQTAYTFGVDAVVSKFNSNITSLLASTFIGSASFRSEYGYAIAVDGSGNIFVTGTVGTATTPNSPATAGAYDTSINGFYDAFVAKLNNNLTSAGFAFTFLGGTGDDRGYGIVTDRNNNVFVCGVAGDSTFPAVGGPYITYGGSGQDGFVARFNNNLTAAGFVSTFLGGTQGDICFGITTDSSNNVIVTGGTASPNFPTVPQVAQIGSADVFVTKFSNGLTTTLYSTIFGGTGYDSSYGITVDLANNIYVTGQTASSNFPVNPPGNTFPGGGTDAFVAKLNPSLNIINSRYLGGSGYDVGWSIAIAPFAEQVFLTGYTTSSNFPTSPPANSPPLDSTLGGTSDMFVTRLNNELGLVASTYLGGAGTESSTGATAKAGIIVDSSANVVLTSFTTSSDFPLSNPITTPYNGSIYVSGGDNFVCRITPDLRGGTASTTSPLAPATINFPANLTSNVLIPPALQWAPPLNAIGTVIYSVYLSTDSYPLTLVYTGSETSAVPPAAYETSYYWYIVASDSSGRVSWTTIYRFTTETDPLFLSGSSGGETFGADSFTKPIGQCFIATAVYGSPTHPNVTALKKFRNNHLSTNFIGRYFVRWYYKISPPVAEHLKHSPLQASAVRFALTPIVYTIKYPALIAFVILILGGLLALRIRRRFGWLNVSRLR
jgi:hypothetical protein